MLGVIPGTRGLIPELGVLPWDGVSALDRVSLLVQGLRPGMGSL